MKITRIQLIACEGNCGNVLEIRDISRKEKIAHENNWRIENYWKGGPIPRQGATCMKCIRKRFYARFKKDYKEDVRLLD